MFTPETQELLIATGFLRNAADDTDEKELTTPDILHGVLQRTSEVVANNLLALTVGCAKCHDHKYEPISQQEYYRLVAAFSPTFNPKSWMPPKSRALADISPKQCAEAERHNAEIDRQIAELRKSQAEIRDQQRTRLAEAKLATIPEAIRADVKAAIETAAAKRNEVQKYLAGKFTASLAVSEGEVAAALSPEQQSTIGEAERQVAQRNSQKRTWGTIQAAYDVGPAPETHLLRRGNHETPGPVVEPGFLTVLCSSEASPQSAAQAALRVSQPRWGRPARPADAVWRWHAGSPIGTRRPEGWRPA